jgi:GDP-L-fucose synthase
MRILITGGSGDIGRFLSNKLIGYDVHTPSSIELNLTHKENVDSFFKYNSRYDVVIHAAIKGGSRLTQDGWSVMDDNLKMYYNLLNHRDSYDKFISFGSGAEIYMNKEPYGMSKSVIANSMLDKEGFYNIRVFGLFGENEKSTRFVKSNIERYVSKSPILIHTNKLMDFFYMEDLLSVVKYYINSSDLPKTVDCSYNGSKKSLRGIATSINNLDKHKVGVTISKKPGSGDLKSYLGDATQLAKLPIPLIGFEKGLKLEYEKYKLCH